MAHLSFRAAADRLPPHSGVYLMKDAHGRVIYVGKAKRLANRVRNYLQPPEHLEPRLQRLMRLSEDLDFIVTESEAEALVLEATLVREHRPQFNIRLKDDKAFPWLKISVADEFPRLSVTRRVADDGARYFGPYTDVGAMRAVLGVLRRVFPLRTCPNIEHYRRLDRPCLNYHIRRCVGPCYSRAGVSREEYRALVEGLILFLSGKHDAVRARLAEEMERAAAARDYERAARLRDHIGQLGSLAEVQRMAGPGERDADAVGVAWQGDHACVAVLQLRHGHVLGRETRFLRGARDSTPAQLLAGFAVQYYLRAAPPPREVWLPEPLPEGRVLEQALAVAGRKLKLRVARRGRGRRLVELAQENATVALEARLARRAGRRGRYQRSVYELQRALALGEPPFRVVGIDISNLGAMDAVASVVVSENGQPRRGDYRRMRMRAGGPDDFAMMREAVSRYFARVAREELPRPDLLLVDGGLGQVGAAREALAEVGLAALPLVGLAKREETVVFPDGRSVVLSRRSPALRSLQRLRDEAHRFAITYNRHVRGRRTVRSVLDEVAGVGPARRRVLLATFGSVAALREASADELVARALVPRPVAERIVAALRAPAPEQGHGGSAA